MRKLITALFVVLCAAIAVRAADNYAATQGAGKTFRCIEITGSICIPTFILTDNTGQVLGSTTSPVGVTGAGITAGADTVSNTLTGISSYSRLQQYNGTTWDRVMGDTTNGLWVNVKSATGVAQGSTTSGQTISPIGCRTLTSAPTDTTAQTNMPWCRTWGALASDLYSWGGTALGAPANFGTTPGAVIAGSQNSSIFLGTVAASANAGTVGTGTLRVVLATDQPQLTNKLLVTPDANSAVNAAQLAGQTLVDNPCQTVARVSSPIGLTTANTTTQVVGPVSAKKVYICAFSLQTTAANSIAVIEGTGSTCGSAVGVYGGATTPTGLQFTANQGIAWGNGQAPVMSTAGTNVGFCLINGQTTNVAGHIEFVQK